MRLGGEGVLDGIGEVEVALGRCLHSRYLCWASGLGWKGWWPGSNHHSTWNVARENQASGIKQHTHELETCHGVCVCVSVCMCSLRFVLVLSHGMKNDREAHMHLKKPQTWKTIGGPLIQNEYNLNK